MHHQHCWPASKLAISLTLTAGIHSFHLKRDTRTHIIKWDLHYMIQHLTPHNMHRSREGTLKLPFNGWLLFSSKYRGGRGESMAEILNISHQKCEGCEGGGTNMDNTDSLHLVRLGRRGSHMMGSGGSLAQEETPVNHNEGMTLIFPCGCHSSLCTLP